MSDCPFCEVESICGYEYKPCDCVRQRKFKEKRSISELREKIFDFVHIGVDAILLDRYNQVSTPRNVREQKTADAILSLIDSSPVEGLEVVRKCEQTMFFIPPDFRQHSPSCPDCHGTGEIVRKMTRGEIEKVFKERIELEGVIELSTGERIRVEGIR